jgi:SpoVK/Ycf46/Vps4 family AAA+-type ATPase
MKTITDNRLDIPSLAKKVWSKKGLYIKVWIVVFILACVWIFPQPRYYTCSVSLAPESTDGKSGGGLASLAASFGLNVGSMSSSDAIYPQLYPDLYVKFKKHSGGGILLYGVPGTGKTRIAQQVAKELDCHFMELKCSNVISKWFGDTEKNLKEIFKEARSHDKTIIFFDEFEALGAVRGKETNSPIGRVVSELLSQMQGFEENSNIIFMAATNRPWDVDPAFLRPGRFNSIIMVDLPDRNARREIVESELDPSMLASDFNIDKVVELTEGFSAADMVEFCERLKDLAIWRIIKSKTDSLICEADILSIKGNLNTSVNAHELKRIRDYKATH